MYICIYVYLYICIYVYMYICIYVYDIHKSMEIWRYGYVSTPIMPPFLITTFPKVRFSCIFEHFEFGLRHKRKTHGFDSLA